jgi:sulfate/thiosulfate transport system ATP-binding protein
MISVNRITKSFGDFTALDDVSIEIAANSLTALLGPSGSGKSTLLRAIAGLEEPDDGTIVVDDVDVTRVPPQRRGIGFVFQHYAAFKHLTVRENVAFGLRIRKRPRDEVAHTVDELLATVGLAGYQGRYPSQLSGGQRQRMALARALAIQPKVLLLDEPFGALDAKVRAELRAWLRRLHEEVHVTTVLVTHDQEEAMELADSIAVLNEGRVEQTGAPRELYDAPANEFVMGFLGPVTHLGGGLVRPHDLVVGPEPESGAVQAQVTRVVHLGFEVRLELALAGDGQLAAQLTRSEVEQLEVAPGDIVYVRSDGHVRRFPRATPAQAQAAAPAQAA